MGETRSGSTRTVHARSTDGRIFAASKCRDRLPFRYPRRERAVLLRDGTGGRRNARDACSPDRAARRAHDHRHRLAGQQRTGRSGKARPRAPGFEAGESDVRRRRAGCERFESRQSRKSRHRRKGDRFRRGESTCRKAGCDGLNARRICRHAGFRESGAIHRCAGRRSLGHLLVRRNSLVSAHRPQAFRGRDHRTDSREPALASSADRTAEGGTCSKPPYFAARVDARGRTGSAPGCPCTHVAIARLPRTDPRSLESGASIRPGRRTDRDHGCRFPDLRETESNHLPEYSALECFGENRRGAAVRESERRQGQRLFCRRRA